MPNGFEKNITPEAKEKKRQELLRQGRGREAIKYALREGLTFGDQDITDALSAVSNVLDLAEKRGDEAETRRLWDEYNKIYDWRLGKVPGL